MTVIGIDDIEGAERPMLGFETLTMAPIDRRLVVAGLLAPEERQWLDAYHARVRELMADRVDPKTAPGSPTPPSRFRVPGP